MKKIITIIMTLLILTPLNINASSIEFNCPTNAKPNSNVECEIKTNNSYKGIKLNISLPSEITTNKIETNWTNHYKGNNGFVVTNSNSTESFISHITLKISEQAEVSQEYQVGLINIEASDNEHRLINIESINKIIKILSDDNTLSNLTITNGSLSPKFNKNTTSYKATINSDKTTITATPSYKNAKVEGNIGEVKLNYGINNIVINVTSEYGSTKTYNISITRPFPTNETTNNKKDNNTTKNNTTSNNKKSFNSVFKKQNKNKIVIDKSSDASLKTLTVKNYKIKFNPNIFNYKLKVPNKITTLDITAIPNNNKAKVDISKPDILEVGKNIITITVTAEDGTICKYELEVTRKNKKINTNKEDNITAEEKIESNKEVSIFPSIPLAIIILIILLILLILYIIIKRIFKKEN